MVTRNNRLWHVVRTIDIPEPPATEPQAWLAPPADNADGCQSDSALPHSASMTIEAYVRIRKAITTYNYIISDSASTRITVPFDSYQGRIEMFITSTGELTGRYKTFDDPQYSWRPISTSSLPSDGGWHRYSYKAGPTGSRLYIDGVEVAAQDVATDGISTGVGVDTIAVGCISYVDDTYLPGRDQYNAESLDICDVRHWGTYRDAADILANIGYKGVQSGAPDLNALYFLDEGTGTTAVDSEGSVDLVLTNDSWWGTQESYDAQTVLLLHADGTDGGSVFTDSSVYDQTATVRDTPTTATAAAKFGSTGLSTAQGDLTYSSTSRFQLTGNPFTIDCWANHQTSGVQHTIACFDSDDAWSTASGIQWILHRWDTDDLRFQFWNGTSISILTSAAIVTSTYQHICVTSDGVDVWLFVDGILEDTATNDMSAVGGSLGLGIGDRFTNPVYNWDGYLDEIRIINGRCAINDPNDPLYISSGNPADGFTPPTSAYPDP